jgi:hypothetical protein
MKTVLNILALVIVVVLAVPAAGDNILWYNVQNGTSADTELYTYNLATGATTDQGSVPGVQLMTNFAFASPGQAYGVGWNNLNGGGNGNLYSISLGTGGAANSFTALQIQGGGISGSPNGIVYANNAIFVSTWDQQFYQLVQSGNNTWTVAAQGAIGYGAVGGMAFGPGGQLYAEVMNGANTQLATINLAAGSSFGLATLVGGAVSTTQCLEGLSYVNGTMYGTLLSGFFGDSTLVTIDPTTGAATTVADLGDGVWGLTSDYGMEMSPTPEPATISLLGVGLAGLIFVRRQRVK